MDARRLRHFVAVAETLHFGRAATRLHMTQPPLSQSIRALEAELGADLFQRTQRRVALTAFGAQWLVPVRAALAGLDALGPTAERMKRGEIGRLALSFVSTADYSLLPDLVARFRAAYPDVTLSLEEATSDVQIAAVLAGTADAGIVIPPARAPLPAALAYTRLLTEPLVAAVPDAWLRDGRLSLAGGALTPAAVVGSPLIVFPHQVAPAFHDLVTGYYHACGGTPDIVQEAIQMQTIISLVSAGMGIALVPASLRHLARTGTRYVPLQSGAPQLETGLIWRADQTSPSLQNFRAIVESCA
ncbi:LysR family transcriptional regulator [Salinisphaera sp. Q1T1-3]|uniref:LysR family transcriptional regulator n=1 Tax=Salinisphaera sp. Q1T1-3 TaxID=2321229 RepID=UPI000E74058F|nr:LysR family transcriptional regulator [Salinisphaera sp. Q1T1-3]RJS93695.1 LysR family transcriptional regulator [Salinisphaera sp. Q1T1-3]